MPVRWLKRQSKKLMDSEDGPHAVALGTAVGMFFGFTPLFGLKTLLALGVTWLARGSKVAALVGVALHDVALPFMPVLLRWEYDIGYWLMSHPHVFPEKMHAHHLKLAEWFNWSTFLTVGRPLLVGSVIVSTPIALITYGTVQWILMRRAAKKKAEAVSVEHPIP